MTQPPLRIREKEKLQLKRREDGKKNKMGDCRREQNRRRFFINGRMT
jgi:hypothetical protein